MDNKPQHDPELVEAAGQIHLHSPAVWATDNIILDGQPFNFIDRHYLNEPYMVTSAEEMVVCKAAQTGFTIWGSVTTLWYLKHPKIFENALYVFPTSTKVNDFAQARLNTILQESPAFKGDNIDVDNVRLKKIGKKNLYFRGAKNEQQITEIPAGIITIDEVDEFPNLAIIAKIKERASGAEYKRFRYLSTPTFPDTGIHRMYEDSSKGQYFLKCGGCGLEQTMDFFKNINFEKPELGVFCRRCSKPMNRLAKGRWVHSQKHERLGYHINQIHSPTVSIKQLCKKYTDALKGGELEMQNFHNMALGMPYIPKGGNMNEAELMRAMSKYSMHEDISRGTHFMGIDVGKELHFTIINEESQMVWFGTVKDFEDLHFYIDKFDVFFFVIDALPETRKALELCETYGGRGAVCYYTNTHTDKDLDGYVKQFGRQREVTLDKTLTAIRRRNMRLPIEVQQDQEFKDHFANLIRVIEDKGEGKKVVKYVDFGKPDHYVHATNYAKIALDSYDPPSIELI